MAEYILTLTPEQDVALAYDTEQMNLQHAQMAGTSTPTVVTPEDVLLQRVAMHLDSTYRQIAGTLDTIGGMVEAVPEDQREILLATTKSAAIRDYVRAKLAQKASAP